MGRGRVATGVSWESPRLLVHMLPPPPDLIVAMASVTLGPPCIIALSLHIPSSHLLQHIHPPHHLANNNNRHLDRVCKTWLTFSGIRLHRVTPPPPCRNRSQVSHSTHHMPLRQMLQRTNASLYRRPIMLIFSPSYDAHSQLIPSFHSSWRPVHLLPWTRPFGVTLRRRLMPYWCLKPRGGG